MEVVEVAPPTGQNRLAPKTSSGTRERTPMCRGPTNRTSEGRETYEGELVAACAMGQSETIRHVSGRMGESGCNRDECRQPQLLQYALVIYLEQVGIGFVGGIEIVDRHRGVVALRVRH